MSLEQQTNIASVQVFQASFADWYLFIQDRIFNDRDGWSSPHINTGLQLVTLGQDECLVSKYSR
jgi:hypothetical protein